MVNRNNRHTNSLGKAPFSPLAAQADAQLIDGPRKRRVRNAGEPTPLAAFVRQRLEELELKQSDFCRLTGFDQGLLSKIQNSVITSLSLESTLRLALGLSIAPRVLFALTERIDMQDLVMRAYALDFFPELSARGGMQIPGPVFEITALALNAYSMGHNLAPAYAILSYLTNAANGSKETKSSSALATETYAL